MWLIMRCVSIHVDKVEIRIIFMQELILSCPVVSLCS
jgi:hypothetical protein